MKFISMSLAISLVFSPFAAIMAYLITYGEYIHHYPDKKKPVKLAPRIAPAEINKNVSMSFGKTTFPVRCEIESRNRANVFFMIAHPNIALYKSTP